MSTELAIVTPVYNRKKYLQKTIDSIHSQSLPVQHVIVDGGSNDGTVDVIRKYDSYLHWWCSEPDNGVYDAINKGFANTDSEIMGWLNSDDILLPGALERIICLFAQYPHIEWITGLATVIDSNDNILRSRGQRRFSCNSFIFGKYRPIQQESTFWRRSLWNRTGGKLNVEYKMAADYELWCKFFFEAPLYFADLPIGAFRKHGDQLSAQYRNEYRVEIESIRKKFRKKRTLLQFIKGKFEYFYENLAEMYSTKNSLHIQYL